MFQHYSLQNTIQFSRLKYFLPTTTNCSGLDGFRIMEFQLNLLSSAVDNPWRCDCALHWLRSWIDEEGQRLLSSAERRLVCTEPPRLSHLSLVEVPLNSLVCIPPLVQLEPRRLAVRLGESLRVSCHASGYPRPQVRECFQLISERLLTCWFSGFDRHGRTLIQIEFACIIF